uniref:Uncharacterized protein n=1 Tax=Nelumbo nucifera TaxID=4432 RepID=A0A822Y589_NELNU|nr:TPA_asm: hypothetical protein HUJ06_030582 [Nelumbo nucifera]
MMTIEAGFVENKRDKVGRPNNKMIRKKKKCMRPKRRRVLQKLFLSCREVFKGPGTVPLPRDVQKLCHILNRMKPEDVGLSKDLLFFQPGREVKGTPRIMCTTIYKCKNFSVRPANSIL